jgi:hypothetical protein
LYKLTIMYIVYTYKIHAEKQNKIFERQLFTPTLKEFYRSFCLNKSISGWFTFVGSGKVP